MGIRAVMMENDHTSTHNEGVSFYVRKVISMHTTLHSVIIA